MRSLVRVIVLLCLVCSTRPTAAQKHGFKFMFPHLDQVYEGDGLPSISLGVGYTRILERGLTSSLEFTFIARSFYGSGKDEHTTSLSYSGWHTFYKESRGGIALVYSAACSIDDPDHFGPYIGTTVGLFLPSRELRVSVPDPDYTAGEIGENPWQKTYNAKALLIPIGLRFGLRSPMVNGAYTDIYTGVGYMIGGGKRLFDEPELGEVEADLTSITWSLSFSVGGLW